MWKTLLNKSIKELRFVLKTGPKHDGVWRFIDKKLPDIIMLNQLTHFSVVEINDNFTSPSACHVVYGDHDLTADIIPSDDLSTEEFESILKSKVQYGLTLDRQHPVTNIDRDLPIDIVEAGKTSKYMDDGFF